MLVPNPVLPGFHSDPSLLRVGDWWYIANSTFEWYPGVEISRSKDLCHWETIAAPLSNTKLLDMRGIFESGGIWAPCLSYSENKFWLIFTVVHSWNRGPWKDEKNYLTTADSIDGPWSLPVYLNSSGFDASMFHDDDGKHWLVNMEWDYRKPGGGPKFTGILLQEYSPSRKRLIGKAKKIYLGTDLQLVEGPHLYHRDDYYYLFCAEGGTQYKKSTRSRRGRDG